MSSSVFLDTAYILALINTGDEYHERARNAALQISGPFLTTDAVLLEIGNALARARWRSLAVATLQDLRTDPEIEVVHVTFELFNRAVEFYASRMDKEWTLTDCISFMVMQDHEATEALTTD